MRQVRGVGGGGFLKVDRASRNGRKRYPSDITFCRKLCLAVSFPVCQVERLAHSPWGGVLGETVRCSRYTFPSYSSCLTDFPALDCAQHGVPKITPRCFHHVSSRWSNFAALSNMVEEILKMRPYCTMQMF